MAKAAPKKSTEELYAWDAEKRGSGLLLCGVDEAGRGPLAGDVYAAAVILQYSSHRFRLPAGGLDDCFIGEKPIISHMPFPPFPLGAAVGLFGYGSPLCCGCARTVCQFRAVEYA